jgi:hypothetical protein
VYPETQLVDPDQLEPPHWAYAWPWAYAEPTVDAAARATKEDFMLKRCNELEVIWKGEAGEKSCPSRENDRLINGQGLSTPSSRDLVRSYGVPHQEGLLVWLDYIN